MFVGKLHKHHHTVQFKDCPHFGPRFEYVRLLIEPVELLLENLNQLRLFDSNGVCERLDNLCICFVEKT